MSEIIINDTEILYKKLCVLVDIRYRSKFEITYHDVLTELDMYFNTYGSIVIDSDQLSFLILKYPEYMSDTYV